MPAFKLSRRHDGASHRPTLRQRLDAVKAKARGLARDTPPQTPTLPWLDPNAPDPIFAAIQRVRRAHAYVNEPVPGDEALVGSPENKAAEEEMIRRGELHDEAYTDLIALHPRTMGGLIALVAFLAERDKRGASYAHTMDYTASIGDVLDAIRETLKGFTAPQPERAAVRCEAERVGLEYGALMRVLTTAQEQAIDAQKRGDNQAALAAENTEEAAERRSSHLLDAATFVRAESLGGALFQVAALLHEVELAGGNFAYLCDASAKPVPEAERQHLRSQAVRVQESANRLAYSIKAALLAHGANPMPAVMDALMPDRLDPETAMRAQVARLLGEAERG